MTQTKIPGVLISRKKAAERAGVTPRTIDEWRALKKITTYKDGHGRVFLDPVEIDKHLEIKAVAP